VSCKSLAQRAHVGQDSNKPPPIPSAGLGAIAKVLQLHNLSNHDSTCKSDQPSVQRCCFCCHQSPDYKSEIAIWGTVETGVTIMAASVPFLRLLIVEARPSREHRPYTPELNIPKKIGDEQDLFMKQYDCEQFLAITKPASVASSGRDKN
jgi:hypothetical protein